MQRDYKLKMSQLQKEVNELRQQGSNGDDTQSASSPSSSSSSSSSSSPSSQASSAPQLRLLISRLERHEDRQMKDQLRQVKDLGRRLERIEDIGCSYFKPSAARCRMQEDMFRQLDKGQLHGIVKRDHLSKILECDPLFCGLTAEENGRLRQIYAKHWQTKLKLNKYRNIVYKLKQLDDDTIPLQK